MMNQRLLNNIYDESKAVNRNLQRLCNIGLMGLILKVGKEQL